MELKLISIGFFFVFSFGMNTYMNGRIASDPFPRCGVRIEASWTRNVTVSEKLFFVLSFGL